MFSKVKSGAAVAALSGIAIMGAPAALASTSDTPKAPSSSAPSAVPYDGPSDILDARCWADAHNRGVSPDVCDHRGKPLTSDQRKCILGIDGAALASIGAFLSGGLEIPALLGVGGNITGALNSCLK